MVTSVHLWSSHSAAAIKHLAKSNLEEEQVDGILQVQSIIEGSQSQDPEADTMKEHHLLAHLQGHA